MQLQGFQNDIKKLLELFESLFDFHYKDDHNVRKIWKGLEDGIDAVFLIEQIHHQYLAYIISEYFDGEFVITTTDRSQYENFVYNLNVVDNDDDSTQIFAYKEKVRDVADES